MGTSRLLFGKAEKTVHERKEQSRREGGAPLSFHRRRAFKCVGKQRKAEERAALGHVVTGSAEEVPAVKKGGKKKTSLPFLLFYLHRDKGKEGKREQQEARLQLSISLLQEDKRRGKDAEGESKTRLEG